MSIADNMKTITDAARKLIESDNTNSHQSIVHWQKGMPENSSAYLISTTNGTVEAFFFERTSNAHQEIFANAVVAWCKLKDIKPYKEETK